MASDTEDVGLRLGEAIRGRRRQLGMTLVEVAASAGLSHPFLSQLERGLARPSMRSLTAIAATLGTTAQALMADSELPAAPEPDPVSIVRRGADEGVPVDSPGGHVRPLVRGERAMLPVEFNGAPRDVRRVLPARRRGIRLRRGGADRGGHRGRAAHGRRRGRRLLRRRPAAPLAQPERRPRSGWWSSSRTCPPAALRADDHR